MTTRRGRKPLAAGHVAHLSGSERAKQRLKLILETLEGVRTIGEACAELDVCQSHFHGLRSGWLQEALELLEPRRMGRSPKNVDTQAALRVAELESALEALQQRAQRAELREEIAQILTTQAPGAPAPLGKKTHAAVHRRRCLNPKRACRPR